MSERSEFRDEMARSCIKRYSMKPDSHPVIAKWKDWDELFDAGYRVASSGEAFQEWLSCH